MKLTQPQIEAARDELVEAINVHTNVEEWLWDMIQDALEDDNVLYDLYADYYDSSLGYLGVSSLENIITELAE